MWRLQIFHFPSLQWERGPQERSRLRNTEVRIPTCESMQSLVSSNIARNAPPKVKCQSSGWNFSNAFDFMISNYPKRLNCVKADVLECLKSSLICIEWTPVILIVENIVNRPKDEANEDEKKGENDGHEGAQPVEKRYRRIITLAHLTMITMILEMQTKANSLFGSN